MPELPEVETTVRTLRRLVKGQNVKGFSATELGASALGTHSPSQISSQLVGKRIAHIGRRGKFILLEFTGQNGTSTKVVNHLRMTGRFIYKNHSEKTPKSKRRIVTPEILIAERDVQDTYVRLSLELENGVLQFADKRRFGTFHLVVPGDVSGTKSQSSIRKVKQNSAIAENCEWEDYKGIARLGPDALDPIVTADWCAAVLKQRKKPIYSTLLDQNIIAGVGNIYACESLARARIAPLKPARELSVYELERLISELKNVLEVAIELGGTSFSDFKSADRKLGRFQEELLVYGKQSTTMNGKIYDVDKLKVSGRSVYYIPEIQS